MVVYVIGLGSMGKRRIKILREFDDIQVIGIDSNENRRMETSNQFEISTFSNLEEAYNVTKGNCAFICSPPITHSEIISNCLNYNLNVFTEINLIADGYEDNIKLAKEKGLVLFLSSTFLYRAEIEYIISKVKKVRTPVNYLYHVGQYLPDWHPWESYKNFFASNIRTNGCREIFAIELPWIVTCFGNIKNVEAIKNKISTLHIDYNDNYLVQIQHESGAKGILAVDVVSRKAVRKLEVYNEDMYLTWNGTPDSVVEYDFNKKNDVQKSFEDTEHREGYAAFITENPYRKEIIEFLNIVNGSKKDCKWDFERDYDVIKIIDKIER